MPRQPRVLIVADDLTGAMDGAGAFAAIGVETWVAASPADCDPASLRSAHVVSVNTDTRHLPGLEAARRVASIARRFGAGGFDIVVKKIDSTLRGNVVDETLALMEASGRREAVVAPAFPAQGRTLREGIVRVDGEPLAHTGFARDALSRPPLAPLPQVFAAAQAGLKVAAVAPSNPFVDAAGTKAWIVDSTTDADLARIVTTLSTRMNSMLMVGSAGIARALARGCFDAAPSPATPSITGTIVFAVGSRAAGCAEQVEALATEPGTAVLALPNGVLGGADIPAALNLVLQVTPGEEGRTGDSQQVAAAMGRHAIRVARHAGAQALVATGGDTALAILAANARPLLRVLGELMPGVPYAHMELGSAPLLLVTKAGGFGGSDIFLHVVQRLRPHE